MTNDEFRDIRLALMLTQQELANLLGYSKKVRVSEFERETNPIKIPIHIERIMNELAANGLPRQPGSYQRSWSIRFVPA